MAIFKEEKRPPMDILPRHNVGVLPHRHIQILVTIKLLATPQLMTDKQKITSCMRIRHSKLSLQSVSYSFSKLC